MSFTSNLREMLWRKVGEEKAYPNRKRMADALGVDPSQLNRFLDGERGLSVDTLGRILDGLGARIVLPEPGAAPGLPPHGGQHPGGSESQPGEGRQPVSPREVCIVSASPTGAAPLAAHRPPESEDYLAVPLASMRLAAGPGRIPEEAVLGWVLVWRHHESVRFRNDLVAVEVGRGEQAMTPALHPGDIVLVDRAERAPDPAGRLMLVCEADGGCAIKRVATKPVEGDMELVFYSDNSRDCPPTVYRLQRDYGGELQRAIGGRVIWAWSDMTRK